MAKHKADPNVKVVKKIASECAAFLAAVEKTGGVIATQGARSKLDGIKSLALNGISVPGPDEVTANADRLRAATSAAVKKAKKNIAKAKAAGKSAPKKKAAKKKAKKGSKRAKAAPAPSPSPALPN